MNSGVSHFMVYDKAKWRSITLFFIEMVTLLKREKYKSTNNNTNK